MGEGGGGFGCDVWVGMARGWDVGEKRNLVFVNWIVDTETIWSNLVCWSLSTVSRNIQKTRVLNSYMKGVKTKIEMQNSKTPLYR